ncbi:MAG: phage tail protein [Candidatus Bathyarchaeia archaeon]
MAQPFDIARFKSSGLTFGGARSSLFQVVFNSTGTTLDTLSQNLPLAGQDKFAFTCRGASLPPATLGVIEAPFFGRRIPLAGDRTFPPWTITVMNDEDWAVRSMFETWSNALNRLQSNVRDPAFINGENNYKADFSVLQYAKTGAVIAQYQIIGAWPSNVDAIQLDWDNQNQIETFGVTLAYDYWLPDASVDASQPNSFYAAAVTDP